MFSEEVTRGKKIVFRMFPTSPGLFKIYYIGVLWADLDVLTRSNRQGKHEVKQKQIHPQG